MSIDKRLLEKKTNKELEEYIRPESRFLPEAIICAHEILKSRGKEFISEESGRISALISKKAKTKEIYIHANHKRSADLIYLSGAFGIGNLIWNYETLDSGLKIFIAVMTASFIFGLGYFISKGNDWIKYILLGLLILGFLGIPFMIADLKRDPVILVINSIQSVLQVWSLILLFKITKPYPAETNHADL